MAVINIRIRDSKGNDINVEDVVRVIIPELHIQGGEESDGFYLEERIVEGLIKFRLSLGICLKITKLIKDNENHHRIGQVIPLKTKKWQWELISQSNNHLQSDQNSAG